MTENRDPRESTEDFHLRIEGNAENKMQMLRRGEERERGAWRVGKENKEGGDTGNKQRGIRQHMCMLKLCCSEK
ncbi:hypothetical protein CFIMG_000708RAa [Ceratocystis fimbriata CBS 114723]|uniref:Uncharacterized protein n=1 Tax=Ceratocystis fimbriata CBS 114723 TaxID=1035309 RepID=A0A2C5X5A6_9PEZI|nr:hypothetical protein CFIMG_000708RAa [Ceratocystis fimbriata CBS 114723]